MRLLTILAPIAALTALPYSSRAQAPAPPAEDWVGKRVVTHFGTVLNDTRTGKLDDQDRSRSRAVSGHDRNEFRLYKVEFATGPWLWLREQEGSAEGWVDASRVIPFDQAIDYFTDLIRANPGSAPWYNRRGTIWQEKGELDIAIADYNEAIRLGPREAMFHLNRGILWNLKNDFDKAIADYNEAIRLDPRYAKAYTARGNAWYSKKGYEKAGADYTEAIRLDSQRTPAYVGRGNVRHARNEYDKAISDYDEAIRHDPRFAIAYANRANAWNAKREYEKAIADCAEAIKIDPNSAAGYSILAWLRATCPDAKYRDGEAAVADATRACELSVWKDVQAVGTLAAAYAERGDFAKAVETQEKALGLFKDEAELKKGRERLELYKAGKPYRETPGGG